MVQRVARANVVERYVARLSREAPSVRTSAGAIVTATLVLVVGSGLLIRLLDSSEYGSVWVGMWWAIQTLTTVGYGDVAPKEVAGRIVGAFVMLQGIAFLAIITAAITSTFVARAGREYSAKQAEGQKTDRQIVEERFDSIDEKLAQLQSALSTLPDE
jgi:voltage-gated potassium channel